VVAAGPAANFILAIAVFAALLMAVGEPAATSRVEKVFPNTPAERAGFRTGDVIVAMNGHRLQHPDEAKRIIILRTGEPIDFLVERQGAQLHLAGTPERGDVTDVLGKTHRLGRMGLQFDDSDQHMRRFGPIDALTGGVVRSKDVVTNTVFYLGRMISGRENADQISGPLGMAQIAGGLAKQTADASKDFPSLALNSLLNILSLVANISVGIGFLNLLPVPVLDGGHLLFYAYEAVARRPLAAKVQAAGYRVGLALVLGLMLFATWNDLQRLRVFNFVGGLFS
jgi:regulator of sigma E protease